MQKRMISRSIGKIAMVAVAICLFSSCSTSGYTLVGSSEYKNADMSEYKTYRMLSADEVKLPKGISEIDYESLLSSVAAEMSMRNFRSDPNSDLVIEFGITMDESYQENTTYGPYGAYYWGTPRSAHWRTAGYMYPSSYSTIRTIKEGILIMDFIDTKSKKHVYSSAVKTNILGDGSKVRNIDEINKATTVLFKKFPISIPK